MNNHHTILKKIGHPLARLVPARQAFPPQTHFGLAVRLLAQGAYLHIFFQQRNTIQHLYDYSIGLRLENLLEAVGWRSIHSAVHLGIVRGKAKARWHAEQSRENELCGWCLFLLLRFLLGKQKKTKKTLLEKRNQSNIRLASRLDFTFSSERSQDLQSSNILIH